MYFLTVYARTFKSYNAMVLIFEADFVYVVNQHALTSNWNIHVENVQISGIITFSNHTQSQKLHKLSCYGNSSAHYIRLCNLYWIFIFFLSIQFMNHNFYQSIYLCSSRIRKTFSLFFVLQIKY